MGIGTLDSVETRWEKNPSQLNTSWLRNIAGASRPQKIGNDDVMRQSFGIHTVLISNVIQQGSRWLRRVVDRILCNTLLVKFEGKRNKDRSRLCWIDCIYQDFSITWIDTKGILGRNLTRSMGVISTYPSLPKGWCQELMMMVMM